ncbi:MAG TPA: ImmA/IrrE family metallo-endopeptidase, partial [Allosphingosinicella sp.]|nr:ImmA/IrrE family metallo-endopeptidase [Allosphingosinicella sp.]
MTQSGVTRWTHPSVLRFAANGDPIRKMEERVRTIVLRAKDAGWNGPPFSPIALARLLNIPVDPSTSVVDARTIPATGGGVRIQYNPQQPRERARFSIAHEIAHALFDDVADATRHRGGDSTVSDDWQLEMLCNLAAAEMVMPAGSLPAGMRVPPIEELLCERLKFDVSVEAYLMRATKAADMPMSFLVASPRSGRGTITYSVDYAVSSPSA